MERDERDGALAGSPIAAICALRQASSAGGAVV
jgi:hypothetical protein